MSMPKCSTEKSNHFGVYTTFTSFVGFKPFTSNLSNLQCDALYFSSLFLQVFLCSTYSLLHILLLPYTNEPYMGISGCVQASATYVVHIHLFCEEQ